MLRDIMLDEVLPAAWLCNCREVTQHSGKVITLLFQQHRGAEWLTRRYYALDEKVHLVILSLFVAHVDHKSVMFEKSATRIRLHSLATTKTQGKVLFRPRLSVSERGTYVTIGDPFAESRPNVFC